MRNIHILPTDKSSRLYLGNNGNFVFGMTQTSIQSKNDDFTNQNISITNSEEIKEGDWFITKGEVFKCTLSDEFIWRNNFDKFPSIKIECKKIILTTDQDLIKDGVQAINDEFLEWFVKNPSCEEIYVNKIESFDFETDKYVYNYKIIIPKEEPKKNWYCAKCESYVSSESLTFEETHQICNTGVIIEEPKQETLEEAYNKIYKSIDFTEFDFTSFAIGAKWQEQQTIEEVFEWLTTNNYLTDLKETLIENFKNK
jgi:hypothetical protein